MKFIVYLIFAIFIKSSKPKPICMLIKSTYSLKTLHNLIMIIFLCNAFFQFFIIKHSNPQNDTLWNRIITDI